MLGKTYIFFADLYFIQNFFVKAGVLLLTTKFLRLPMKKTGWRIALIAAIGTICEIAGLYWIPDYNLFLGMMHLVEIPCMILGLIYSKERTWSKELLWRGIVSGYFCTLVINGVVEVLWNLIGYGWLYPLLVFAGTVISIVVVYYVIRRLQMRKGIYPVEIVRPNVVWTVKGYYDSGNCLIDPYTGRGVHIISKRLAKRLQLEQESKVCIPYHSLGNTNGLIDVYYVENMRIRKDSEWVERAKVPLGVAEDELFDRKNYEMIINEEVW